MRQGGRRFGALRSTPARSHPAPLEGGGALPKSPDRVLPHRWPSPAAAPCAEHVGHAGWHSRAGAAMRSAYQAIPAVRAASGALPQAWPRECVARTPYARSARPMQQSRKLPVHCHLRTRLRVRALRYRAGAARHLRDRPESSRD